MSLIFGQKWTSALPTPELVDELSREWGDALRGVADETILRVLDYVRDERGEPWPPNLAEFLGLCRQFRVDPPAPPQLPKPVSDRSPDGLSVDDYLARMRAGLGPPQSVRDPEGYRERVEAHEAMIAAARAEGRFRTRAADQFHLCSVSNCQQAGALTGSINGAAQWYCAAHFHRD